MQVEASPDTVRPCARRSRLHSKPSQRVRPAPSRAWPGAAAARRCPGNSSGRSIRGRSTGWRRGCHRGRCSSPRRTARRRRRRWRPRSCAPGSGSPRTARGRTSSRASPPPSSTPVARSSGCSRRTRRHSPSSRGRLRPKALLLCNLFRDQLDRYGELEHVAARWRRAVAALPVATLVVNGDDPQVGDLADGRARALTFGLDDPRHARLRAAARRRLEVLPALRRSVRLRRRVRRAPRRFPLSERPPCAAARSTSPRGRSCCEGSTAPRSRSRRRAARPGSSWSCQASTTSTTRVAAASLALALERSARRDRRRAWAVLGSLRALRAHRGRRPAAPHAADQESRRGE